MSQSQQEEEMVGSDSTAVVVSRSKREDRTRAKHGTKFSQWKILVGPCDWEAYSLGKDGAERYRFHNLPGISTPGVYELAIPLSQTGGLGRNVAKLDPEGMVVVYIGHAEDVRTRLQHYGRTGAHLGSGCSTAHPTPCLSKGPGLFEEIFSRGYPIMFRWAPMQSKSDAQQTETRLLDKFDYAWNKRINGSRRPDDILEKLVKISSGCNHSPTIDRRLLSWSLGQMGIRIKAAKSLATENNFNACADEERPNILSRVFKFGRSRPRSVLDTSGITQGNNVICGVALTLDSVCTRAPVEGRMRCAEHKGMKINELTTVRISNSNGIYGSQYGVIDSSKSDGHGKSGFRHGTVTVEYHVSKSFSPICGFTLTDGSPSRRQAVQGNKRCDEHKGRGIGKSNSRLVSTEEKPLYTLDVFESNSGDTSEYDNITCGATTENGTACKREPVEGNKRCRQHSGMRAGGDTSVAICNHGRLEDEVLSSRINQNKNGIGVVTCGATTNNGTACKREPVEGNKRCRQHSGMRAGGDTLAAICNHGRLEDEVLSSRINQNKNGIGVVTCGATTNNGTACKREPVEGNKRCRQHSGMRAGGDTSAAICNHGRLEDEVLSSGINQNKNGRGVVTCGATTNNGIACKREPVEGNKRCRQHSDMRAGGDTSDAICNHGRLEDEVLSSRVNQNKNGIGVVTCGATTNNGTACKREPVEGNKRCWWHSGMRAGGDTSEYYNNSAAIRNHGRLKYEVSSSRINQNMYGIGVVTCGATTRNGTACTRKPVPGNRRCWQHTGMRAGTSYY
ncbi:protein EFFECTOR OF TRANSCRIPTION 2 isoform X1 [Ziziphus jujuba]|uniref:Protein EFFECTOR OF TRANSCRIPTION 2 isoform X1 n=2 Tax=Ziziphus jujuba TaxID=326968 RepID=A0A6P4AT29_ZIZJJ|nr:protein EFFECTOR OF TRANSCRIPTION 2 isoform X1 [Ziziphus jujuba]